jgi:SOS-response transcriptional repressor LexA
VDHPDHPPLGREDLIGSNGFGVMVKGESMAGRGIHDGDTVWVNPDLPYRIGRVVLALVVAEAGGEASMLVKTYVRDAGGEPYLVSETGDHAQQRVVCWEFKVIGPIVGFTSWHRL